MKATLRLAASLASLAACAAMAEWRVFDLGAPDERVTEIRVAAVNDRGEIAGGLTLSTPSGAPERAAFIYSRGQFHLFGNTTTQAPTVVRDLNRSGVAVGIDTSAFTYDGALARIPGLDGFSVAHAISDKGTIVGRMATPAGHRAFVHAAGTTTELGTLGGDFSEAFAINRKGDIVGHSRLPGGSQARAFVSPRGGPMIALPPMGGFFSSAYAVNDRGDIAGAAQNENLAKRAFLYRDGAMVDLGALPGFFSSDAVGLNDRRQVVGISVGFSAGSVVARPVLWEDGSMTDLAALPELAAAGFASWTIRGELVGFNGGEGPGIAINDHGQIAGAGIKDGRPHLFLLSPTGRGPG